MPGEYQKNIPESEIKSMYEAEKDIPANVRGEHLEKEREHRIKRRVYSTEDPVEYLQFLVGEGGGKIFENPDTELVNFYETNDGIKNSNQRGEFGNYVISQVGESPKRSFNYRDCTSIIAAGETQEGKQLSFVTHQSRLALLGQNRDKFEQDITQCAMELKKQARPETIDIVIVGGNYYVSEDGIDSPQSTKYIDSISIIEELVQKAFEMNVSPVVLLGPEHSEALSPDSYSDVVYDTQARTVLVARPEQHIQLTDDVYSSSDAGVFQEKIEKNRKERPLQESPFPSIRLQKKLEEQGISIPLKEHEVQTRESLKELGVPIWDETTLQHSSDHVTSSIREKDYVDCFTYNKKACALKKEKLETIPNSEALLETMVGVLEKISKHHYKINNSIKTFGYFHNNETGDVQCMLGKQGLYYVEHMKGSSNEVKEHVHLKNAAMFTESFHRFVDEFVKPENRGQMIQRLHEKMKEYLTEHVSEKTVDKIYNFF